jgi:hypothetical protein
MPGHGASVCRISALSLLQADWRISGLTDRSTRQSAADCAILASLTSSSESNGRMARTYVLVVICEIAVIGGLWLLDRFYS